MLVYVFDTNVILYRILPPEFFPEKDRAIAQKTRNVFEEKIFVQWLRNEVTLIIPNFIVAEILKILAQMVFLNDSIEKADKENIYNRYKDEFIESVRYHTVFDEKRDNKNVNKYFNYELNRHHILNLDGIFMMDFQTPVQFYKGKPKILSTHDALLISVGVELQRLFNKDAVFLVTTDRRVFDVCTSHYPKLPFGINLYHDNANLFPEVIAMQAIKLPNSNSGK